MKKTKQKLTTLILGVFLFTGAILPITVFAQDYEDSPFGFLPAGIFKEGYPNKGFSDAQNIGIRWTRSDVSAFWFIVQPDLADTTLNFSMYNQRYGSVPEDIHILANISPQGPIDKGYCISGTWIPIDTLKYIRFVEATVERYDGDGIDDMPGLTNPIKYWQVGNEPNDTLVTDFATLQQITYQAIKNADSTSTVLIGGVAGFPYDYILQFENIYAPILTELAGNYIDVFDFHWYGTANGEYRLKDAVSGEDVLDHIRTTLDTCGYPADLSVWITEMGSYSGDPTNPFGPDIFPYQSESQQAGDYLKRFVYSLSKGVKKIFPGFGLIEGFKYEGGYFDFTGLIYDGWGPYDMGLGIKKLAYFSYKKMTEKLEGSDWDNIQAIQESDNTYIYKFLKQGEPTYAAWWDYFNDPTYTIGDSSLVTLTGISSSQVIVTDAVPNYPSGNYITNYDTAFNIDTLTVSGGSVSFYLKEGPVFVEEYNATSVNEINLSDDDIKIYPNPSTGIFTIQCKKILSIRIINIRGQMVYSSDGLKSLDEFHVDLNNQPKGIYFVKIRSDDFISVKKIVIQ